MSDNALKKEEISRGYRWYVNVSGQSHGPYMTSEIQRFFHEGRLSSNSHVWREGFSDWIPLGKAREIIETGVYFGSVANSQSTSKKSLLWDRAGAFLIDVTLTALCSWLSLFILANAQSFFKRLQGWEILLDTSSYFVIGYVVFTVLLMNQFVLPLFTGYTLGKRIKGLVILTDQGKKPGTVRMGLRFLLWLFMVPVIVMIPFWIFLGRDNRTLYDRLSKTLVVSMRSLRKQDR